MFNRAGRGNPGTQTVGDDIMAQADDWSPRKFLTFWSGLTPESKKAFIGGTRYRDLRKPLDDLVRASEQLKDAEKFRNFSNTGGALIWASVLGAGGATGALVDTAAGGAVSMSVLSGYGLQKLMQHPRFVRWLSKAPSQVKGSKSLADYVGRLAYVATVEPEIKDEIEEIIEDLETDEVPEDAIEAPTQDIGEEVSPVDVSDEAPSTDDDTNLDEVLDTVNYNSALTFVCNKVFLI